MPRHTRVSVGDTVYHVINRANGRQQIFDTDTEYQHFEKLLLEAKDLVDMRILAYCIMPNHWHLVLYPKSDSDMGEYMRWITTTHVRQRRVITKSVGHGHLYQGTYKSFPVETNEYLIYLIRYVEQNPLRAHLVQTAEDWKWSSLWRREQGSEKEKQLLAPLPTELPANYLQSVNELFDTEKLIALRYSLNKGAPYGSTSWMEDMVQTFSMQGTLRGAGRPRKE